MDLTQKEIMVLKEALVEFINARLPVHRYVESRYVGHERSFIQKKQESVGARVILAHGLFSKLDK